MYNSNSTYCLIRFACIVAVSLGLGLVVGCQTGDRPVVDDASDNPLEARYLLDPASPNCGLDYSLVSAGLPKPGEKGAFRSGDVITPADNNGIRDEVVLGLQDPGLAERNGINLQLIDPLSCVVVHELQATPGEEPGRYAVTWNGLDSNAEPMRPGSYYVASHPRYGIDAQNIIVGARDFRCDLPGETRVPLQSKKQLEAGDSPVEIEVPFTANERSELCITLAVPEGGDAGEALDFSLTLDGEELLTDDNVVVPGEITVAAIRNDGTGLAKLLLQKGIVVIGVDLIPDPPPTPQPPIDREDITCEGGMLGFKHPLRPELPRPVIERGGLPIRCEAVYESFEIGYTGAYLPPDLVIGGGVSSPIVIGMDSTSRRYVESTDVLTEADGSYTATITREQQEQNVAADAGLISVRAYCTDESLCGMESPLSLKLDSDENMDIVNIVDLAANGFTARLLSDGPPYGPDGDRNDLPLVIQEQFDPLRENGSEFLVWLLAGQPVDRRLKASEDIAADPCTQNIRGRCVPFRDGCRWTPACSEDTGDGTVFCGETNVLAPFLAAGYDVWLVDQTVRDALIRESAGGIPELYQKIIDYPSPDGDTARPRQLGVLGLSSGAVSSRLALGMWEAKSDVAAGAVPNLAFPSDPAAFDDSPSRVALYMSFDGPHRGARVPIPLQRYLLDPDLNTLDPPPQTSLPAVLASDAARELLQESLVSANTPCFRDDKFFVRPCDFGPQELLPSATESNTDLGQAIRRLGLLGPDDTAANNVVDTIPAVAIANSSIENGPQFTDDRMLKVTFDLGERNVEHTIRAALPQGPGSGLANLCQAGELSGVTENMIGRLQRLWVTARCTEAGEWVPFGDLVCGAALITSLYPILPFVDPVSAVISIEAPMQFPTFIPNDSALLMEGTEGNTESDVPDLWDDALWFDGPLSHFAVSDEHCKFVLYHLDGHMKGDRDGFPACESERLRANCSGGGYLPGRILDPNGTFPARTAPFCDPNDNVRAIVPISAGGGGSVVNPNL